MAATKWFDLADKGFLLGAENGDGVSRILLLDVDDKADADKLLVAGFARMRGSPACGGGCTTLAAKISASRAQSLQPPWACPVAPWWSRSATRSRGSSARPSRKNWQKLVGCVAAIPQVGPEQEGNPVFESPTGRLIQRPQRMALSRSLRPAPKLAEAWGRRVSVRR